MSYDSDDARKDRWIELSDPDREGLAKAAQRSINNHYAIKLRQACEVAAEAQTNCANQHAAVHLSTAQSELCKAIQEMLK